MTFNICIIGNAQVYYDYYIRFLYQSLLASGHRCIIQDNSLEARSANIVVATNPYLTNPAVRDGIRNCAGPVGILFLEYMQERAALSGGSLSVDDDEVRALFGRFDFVLTPLRHSVDALRSLNEKTFHCRLGWVDGLFPAYPTEDPPVDVFFFGGVKDHPTRRGRALAALKSSGLNVVHHATGVSRISRDSLIAGSKLCLNLTHEAPLDHISGKICHIVNAGGVCVSTEGTDSDGYLTYARASDYASLVDCCTDLIRTGAWIEDREKYRSLLRSTSGKESLAVFLGSLT